jgi:hypothetical protein
MGEVPDAGIVVVIHPCLVSCGRLSSSSPSRHWSVLLYRLYCRLPEPEASASFNSRIYHKYSFFPQSQLSLPLMAKASASQPIRMLLSLHPPFSLILAHGDSSDRRLTWWVRPGSSRGVHILSTSTPESPLGPRSPTYLGARKTLHFRGAHTQRQEFWKMLPCVGLMWGERRNKRNVKTKTRSRRRGGKHSSTRIEPSDDAGSS